MTAPRMAEPGEVLRALPNVRMIDDPTPRTRAELEAAVGHPVRSLTITCEHAVRGKLKRPRLAVAVTVIPRVWDIGATFSDALGLILARDERGQMVTSHSQRHMATIGRDGEPRHRQSERETECTTCGDRLQHRDGPRLAAALDALAAATATGQPVTLAELRRRYNAQPSTR